MGFQGKAIEVRFSEPSDEAFLRRLKNHKLFRRINFNARPVAKEEHRRWFADFLKNHYSFTIYFDKKKVGNIRFQKIKPGVLLIGIAILPEYNGHGIGPEAMKLSLRLLKQKEGGSTIIAEVRTINEAAQKFFLKNGFELDFLTFKRKVSE